MSNLSERTPVAKGIGPTIKQAWHDNFIWRQRIEVTENGETFTVLRAPDPLQNPIKLFAQLSAKDWLFFIVGFLSWCADAFDFHALSIQTTKFAQYFHTTNTNITTAITLTLLLRSVGAAIFGLLGDRFGRKWPMVANMIVLGLLQVATIYCTTFQEFLAVRSLFGLFMGGVYGNAMSMALEHCPVNARGLMSGILQQGYAFGYVLAACVNLGVGGAPESFKTVFWVGAGFSIGVGLIRILFPESKQFLAARKAGKKAVTPGAFMRETKRMLAREWKMCIYCIFLMTWFNFYSHTSQDSYTTFMKDSKGLANAPATRASIWMKVGACVGGTIMGYLSQWLGRRRTMIVSAIISAALIPAWILPKKEAGLSASGFMIQFFVQGAWGVIPIHLNELSPPAFRSSFPGITYQLGNMISSPAAQIVNAIAEKTFVRDAKGPHVPAYGPVMGVATAIIATGIAVTCAIGPENIGRHFENALPAAVASQTSLDKVGHEKVGHESHVEEVSSEDKSESEKNPV